MTDEPVRGGTIEDITPAPRTLDPVGSQDVPSGAIMQQLHDGLTVLPDGETEAELLLAESVETNDDFTEYTFEITQGVRYHDGRKVTAGDFVYAWERAAASEHSQTAQLPLDVLGIGHETDDDGGYVPWSLAVEDVDSHTLRMELEKPFHSTLAVLASPCFFPIPEGIVGDVDGVDGEVDHEAFATSNPVGCGPFEFEEWVDDEDVRVSRFDDYHGQVAHADDVHWRIIQPAGERYEYSMDKRTDRIFLTTAAYEEEKIEIEETDEMGHEFGTYGPMRNGEYADYFRVLELSVFYFGFNVAAVPKPVRQAVAYAINPHYLAGVVFKNRSEPAYHVTPPPVFPGGREAYDRHVEEKYPYGVDESRVEDARATMEDAGYSADDPYEVTFQVYELESWVDVAEIIADGVAEAHVDVEIEQLSPRALAEAGEAGDLEMYTLGRVGIWPAPDTLLQGIYPDNTDTSQDAPLSYVNWRGTDAAERAAEAAEVIRSNPEPTEAARRTREEAYLALEEANWEDVVYLTSFHNRSERLTYRHAHYPPYGPMGRWRQKMNAVWKEPE